MTGTRQDYGEVYNVARRNARVRSIPFVLTREEYDDLVLECGGRCSLSCIPFDFTPEVAGQRRPFKASLDRIDNNKGYSYGNCRLVCALVNIAMNQWGLAPLMRLAYALIDGADEIDEKHREFLDGPDRVFKQKPSAQLALFAEAV